MQPERLRRVLRKVTLEVSIAIKKGQVEAVGYMLTLAGSVDNSRQHLRKPHFAKTKCIGKRESGFVP